MRCIWIIVFILRFFPSYKKYLENQIVLFLIAVIEIVRRFIWNIFRLENEHLNNCGQFRAVRDIPLPYETTKEEEEISDSSSQRSSLGDSSPIFSKLNTLWKRKSEQISSPRTSKSDESLLRIAEEGKAGYHTFASLN